LISYYGLEAEAGAIHDLFDLISRESLRSFDHSCDRPCSPINGNGFPIQFSISLGAATRSLRCLGELAAPGMSMPERLRLTTLRLREVLSFLGCGSASPAINQLFAMLFPGDPAAVLRWTGGIWMAFGAAPGHPLAFRLYLNQRWGDIPERFVRVGRVFAALGRGHSLSEWKRVAGPVSAGAVPYGVAFDVIPGGVGRFKVYLTCSGADRAYLASLLSHLDLRHHLDRVMLWLERCGLDRRGLAPWGVLPSLEFSAEPGDPVGLKLDVSCHHLQTSDAEMDERIHIYLHEFSFDPEEYEAALGAMTRGPLSGDRVERIQYCGVGFLGGDAARFNVYFCPDVCGPGLSRSGEGR
jgi:hypothetical protein